MKTEVKDIPNELSQSFGKVETRVELMRLYGDSKFPFSGVNEDGERVLVSINPDSIIVNTYQSNGWVRVNYYDESGYNDGETFDGRWK